MTGTIFDIKGFALHDGPGIRTTVFLKGCPLRCLWCHNPEGLSREPQLCVKETACMHCGLCFKPCSHADCQPFGRCLHICPNGCLSIAGERMEAADLAERLLRDRDVFEMSGGGVTFSGGEPMMQAPFVREVIREMKRKFPVHTAVETCGYCSSDEFRQTVDLLDYVIMDIKLPDSDAHRKYTGVPNERILENFRWLTSVGKPCLIRTPLIPGITDTEENLTAIRDLIGNTPWETLPYNALAGAKYGNFGMTYGMDALLE